MALCILIHLIIVTTLCSGYCYYILHLMKVRHRELTEPGQVYMCGCVLRFKYQLSELKLYQGGPKKTQNYLLEGRALVVQPFPAR